MNEETMGTMLRKTRCVVPMICLRLPGQETVFCRMTQLPADGIQVFLRIAEQSALKRKTIAPTSAAVDADASMSRESDGRMPTSGASCVNASMSRQFNGIPIARKSDDGVLTEHMLRTGRDILRLCGIGSADVRKECFRKGAERQYELSEFLGSPENDHAAQACRDSELCQSRNSLAGSVP